MVNFSGGISSWLAAKRVAEKHGTDNLELIFADTKIEDEDLYRFLDDAAANVGGNLIKIAEGRTPWQVFFDERMMGNSRVDPCSKILKRKLLWKYIRENHCPDNAIVYFGLNWDEARRLEGVREAQPEWQIESPLCEPPYVWKEKMLAEARAAGLRPSRMYELGYPHDNCGGTCVKAGHGNWLHTLKIFPEREEKEQEFIKFKGKKVAILRDRRGGKTRPLTLRELRLRYEADPTSIKSQYKFDWGGCGCAV